MTAMFDRGHRGRSGRRLVSAVAVGLLAASGIGAGLVRVAGAAPVQGAGSAGTAGSGVVVAPAAARQSLPVGPTTTYARPPGGLPACTSDTYTVPSGVTYLRVDVIGQAGTSGADTIRGGGSGGEGQEVQADIPVTPGQSLYVNVAYNGSGGTASLGSTTAGGNGGDASYITADPNALIWSPSTGVCELNSFLVIAGGGGGGGGGGAFGGGGNGGHAGFSAGTGGGAGGHDGSASGAGGGGGTQTAGGAGGNGANGTAGGGNANGGGYGLPGAFLAGGCGGRCDNLAANLNGSGGGGGGYYGGGGGGDGQSAGGGGGGGGSSFVTAGATHVSHSLTGSAPSVSLTPIIERPDAPTGVSAVVGQQRATVSFTPAAIDGGSPVEYNTVTAHPGGVSVRTTATSVLFTNLTAGTAYTFTVTATNLAGAGPDSQPSNTVVPYRLPGAPVIQSVTPGDGQATVSFTPSAADNRLGNPITSYTVTARQGVHVTTGPGITATGTTSPITVAGLTDGSNYTFTVYATNAAGNGPQSAPKVTTPQAVPGPPTNVTATNATPVGASSGTVDVSFTAPSSDGGRPVLSYTATATPGGVTGTAGVVTGSGTGSVQITGLKAGTSYTFTVHATNAVGNGPESAPSSPVTPSPVGIPSPPLVPGAATLNEQAYVSCRPPPDDGGSAIVSYTVTSSPGGVTATGPSCPILVSGLTNGTSYTFTLTATNADGGTSQPSQPTAAITPHAPSGPPPANDDFASARELSGASGSVVGTNVGATLESGEPNIGDNPGGASVWYEWTAPASGAVEFDTCSATPAVNAELGYFLGSSVSTLTQYDFYTSVPGQPTGCPSGQAGAFSIVGVTVGQTYYVKVDGINNRDGNGASEGPFTLEWSMPS